MRTITQAFAEFLQRLELTDAEREKASTQQNVVRDRLRQNLSGFERDILSGSYSRRTAIRPLNDIDIFIILDARYHADVYPHAPPEQCLKKVQHALAQAYPNKEQARIQGRSVNIEFTGTGISYDVVPAFSDAGGVYRIPDRGRQSWIRTDPEKHKTACQAANERAGSKLNPLIKAAKRWNCENGRLLRSFHLEVMAYQAFNAPPSNYQEGLRALFAHLADAVARTCADLAGVGPNIDAGMTSEERGRIQKALREAAAQAQRAVELERLGRTEEAHSLWRGLLGADYPEKGR
jgi:hypothetical protein